VRSNFKFTPKKECICVVCWDADTIRAEFTQPTQSQERAMLAREYRHAGEEFS
jgi:hypothetical protein